MPQSQEQVPGKQSSSTNRSGRRHSRPHNDYEAKQARTEKYLERLANGEAFSLNDDSPLPS